MAKTVTDLEAERRRINAELRAAKRAAKKAAEAALLDARHRLGVAVAEHHGADTPEAVATLLDLLISDHAAQAEQQSGGPGFDHVEQQSAAPDVSGTWTADDSFGGRQSM